MTLRKRTSRAGMPAAGRVPRTSAPAGAIASSRRSTAATGAAAPSSAHDHPPKAIALVVMAAVAKVTSAIERQGPAGGRGGQRPEHHEIGGDHQQQAPGHGPLAQAGRPPLELEELLTPRAEAIHDPARQPEEPQLLGRVRLDRQAVGVFGVALGPADFLGVPVAPHAALAQQPVRGQPRAGQHDRRPPRIGRRARRAEARPAIISTSPEAMKSIEMNIGGPVMPRSKSRAIVRSLVSFGSSRWPIPGGFTQAKVSRS